MTHFFNSNNPFDILCRDLFKDESIFNRPARETLNHPADVWENAEGLTLEIACTGLSKDNIDISVEGDVLKVKSNKGNSTVEDHGEGFIPHHNGIRKSKFNIGWKISRRFNISKIEADMENGLLILNIPFSKEAKPQSIKIK